MYVCICNAIRESEVREAACAVDGDAEAVYRALGKEPQCGLCLEDAALVLACARSKQKQPHFA